jgi:hypothetical protein
LVDDVRFRNELPIEASEFLRDGAGEGDGDSDWRIAAASEDVLLRRVVLGAVSVDSTDGLHVRAIPMSGEAQGNACETTTR